MLTPKVGRVYRNVNSDTTVVEWEVATFSIGGKMASGSVLTEHWNSELEMISEEELSKEKKDAGVKDNSDSEKKEKTYTREISEDIDDYDSSEEAEDDGEKAVPKYNKNEWDLDPGDELPGPRDYGNEVTGPIILTNHPERWQVQELPDGTKFRWNGEVWIDIDEDEMPKDEKEREDFFKDCPSEKDKWEQKHQPTPPVIHSQDDIDKLEKYNFVKMRGYTLLEDRKSFKDSAGHVLSAEQVKELYEIYRVQSIVYERLKTLIMNDALNGFEKSKMIDLYKWFRDHNNTWSKAQCSWAAGVCKNHKTVLKQLQGPQYRDIKDSKGGYIKESDLD